MAYQTHAETYQSLGVLAEIQKPTCAEDAYASLLQWCKIFICFGFRFHFNLIDVSHKMTSGCFLQQWFSYDTLGVCMTRWLSWTVLFKHLFVCGKPVRLRNSVWIGSNRSNQWTRIEHLTLTHSTYMVHYIIRHLTIIFKTLFVFP